MRKPEDFNASASAYLRNLWSGVILPAVATLTGPDGTGYYTVTLTGTTVPANAVMLTGGMGYSYNVKTAQPLTQTNLAAYPTRSRRNAGLYVGMPNATGGLIVIAPNASKVATGFHRTPCDRRGQALQLLPPGTRHVHRGCVPRGPAQRRHDLLVVSQPQPQQQRLDS